MLCHSFLFLKEQIKDIIIAERERETFGSGNGSINLYLVVFLISYGIFRTQIRE
jgi:hypothetical protein